jgi:hypothetical protein
MLRVLLLQLPVPANPALNTPLAAGYLAAHARARLAPELVTIEILPRAIADHAGDAALVAQIVARAPDVLGMSLYTWNSTRSLAVATRVRAAIPDIRIVVGGPEVQRDNPWVLWHDAVDVAVLGEGEHTFCELLAGWTRRRAVPEIAGIAYRHAGEQRITPARPAIDDLAAIPSPYLGGLLEVPADGLQLVEISRWCPYACSFCLYGRDAGVKLRNRMFPLERVLAEIAWGRQHGVRQVHFVEANLNLVPAFRGLMEALAIDNADRQQAFYAELRGEHLDDAVVAMLVAANVSTVEVGLQSANPAALRAVARRTDLARWAAGTRRLRAAGITVLLDVILGLPADDEAGVAQTLRFIEGEALGEYEVFMLQVLPGTALRAEAARYGIVAQPRPPYFVLGTDRLAYGQLRAVRQALRLRSGIDPQLVEGLPAPHADALAADAARRWAPGDALTSASHVDCVLASTQLAETDAALVAWITANPACLLDLYLVGAPPPAAWLRRWRAGLPYTPGYLDGVAVYQSPEPAPTGVRVSPRLWLVVPWEHAVEPADYGDVAAIIWQVVVDAPDLPLSAWRGAGGAGLLLTCGGTLDASAFAAAVAQAQAWAAALGVVIWVRPPA